MDKRYIDEAVEKIKKEPNDSMWNFNVGSVIKKAMGDAIEFAMDHHTRGKDELIEMFYDKVKP